MPKHQVQLDDLGSSRVLSRGQAKWLDGDDEALTRDDRKIRSEIKGRVESAIKELQFVNERSDRVHLDKIARPQIQPNGELTEVNSSGVRNAMGTAEMLAKSMGEGDSINSLLKSLSEAPENATNAQLVAQVVSAIFEEAGYEESEYADHWAEFSDEIGTVLKKEC